ncbi:MAG: hypothetical protein L6311_00715 [Cellulomonas sp.]|nr:hypothetical protein [Cellulomonas sp.]
MDRLGRTLRNTRFVGRLWLVAGGWGLGAGSAGSAEWSAGRPGDRAGRTAGWPAGRSASIGAAEGACYAVLAAVLPAARVGPPTTLVGFGLLVLVATVRSEKLLLLAASHARQRRVVFAERVTPAPSVDAAGPEPVRWWRSLASGAAAPPTVGLGAAAPPTPGPGPRRGGTTGPDSVAPRRRAIRERSLSGRPSRMC